MYGPVTLYRDLTCNAKAEIWDKASIQSTNSAPADALFLFWLIVRAPVLVRVHGTGRWELIVHGRLGH
jgi:hypothetical protein